MNPRRTLVLGAHPDDEMACSGLLARLSGQVGRVDAIAFTDCSDALPAGFSAKDLAFEYAAAMVLLGVTEATLLDLPNRRLPEHRQDILDRLDPLRDVYDLVLVPASSDAHQDHHAVSENAIRVFKRSTVLGYELPLNTVLESRLTCYVRLSPEQVDLKVRHAATYRSQAGKPYMAEAFIRGLAAVRGVQAGHGAAEAYEVLRWVW